MGPIGLGSIVSYYLLCIKLIIGSVSSKGLAFLLTPAVKVSSFNTWNSSFLHRVNCVFTSEFGLGLDLQISAEAVPFPTHVHDAMRECKRRHSPHATEYAILPLSSHLYSCAM